MYILGIDFGTKIIGLSIADEKIKIATPWKNIKFPKNNYFYAICQIKKLISQYEIKFIVLGYPLNMNGSISKSSQLVEQFKKLLEDNLKINVILWDERLSTKHSIELLKENALLKSSQIKKIKDKVAAQYILQDYIDNN